MKMKLKHIISTFNSSQLFFSMGKKCLKVALFILFSTLVAFFCFYKLSTPSLERWDEHTNYKVVEESLRSTDPLELKYEGEPFLEKTPLWYWASMVSVQIFGLNNFSIRFISAISGSAVILLTFYIGWKMFSYKAGLISGMVLLATRQLFVKHTEIFATHTFRSANLDSLQILFMLITFILFYKFYKNKRCLGYLFAAGISTGLGFLTKGPLSLVPPIVFFTFLTTNRNSLKLKPFQIMRFFTLHFSLFIIVTLPWHIWMFVINGNEFVTQYFIYHILGRGLTALEGHQESVFYYVKLLFRKDFFFSGEILLASVIFLILKYKRKIFVDFSLLSCLAVCCLLLLTVSLAQTKLAWYLLPIYPFAALLIGKFFHDIWNVKNKLLRIIVISIVILTLGSQTFSNLYIILQL
ncbi:glycosyltransferase family 39 protein [Patescibacteria group bacterium]|nr:glycosyltransferase family 39 protein [Patescibacteria group bacterium]